MSFHSGLIVFSEDLLGYISRAPDPVVDTPLESVFGSAKGTWPPVMALPHTGSRCCPFIIAFVLGVRVKVK